MNKTSKSISKQRGSKRLQLVIIAIVIAIIAGVGVVVAMSRKADDSKQNKPQNRSVSLHGELVCLPHKNATDGRPQTLECAIGFKSEEGKYYSLKDGTNRASMFPLNTQVVVSGTLQAESSEVYQSEGSIIVADIKEHAH